MSNMKPKAILFLIPALVVGLNVQADVVEQKSNESNRILSVTGEAWQPEGFVNGIAVPAIHLPSSNVVLDGMESEPEWEKAPEVTVPLTYGNVPEISLKAMYTQDEVFIRLRWPDDEANRQHRPWVWDAEQESYRESAQVEDSVMLSFEAGCEWTPSLLGGYMYDFDAWQWMAARTDPLGQAVDLYGNVQDRGLSSIGFVEYPSRILKDDWIVKFTENQEVDLHADWNELDRVYMLMPVTETLYVKAVPDGGRLSPPVFEQLPAPDATPQDGTQIYPQFSPLPLEGGAGEVKAKGHWEDGYWTVEFRRDRLTPAEHIYDTIFNRTVQFSVHVFNGTERLDEVAESPRLFLRFLPEEEPLLVRD
jgi:hypothetical protein